jgi:hypothetical protein
MGYLWVPAQSVQVEISEHQEPQAFRWQDQRHPVQTILSHWRVDQGWWEERAWRDYFRILTSTGMVVEIYCNLLDGQ